MILTIGMIVKNEEKYLERCLSAIKPILDNVDSELIITDTGSTDRTVEIAGKYTDKILHFDWIDDFSAARNTGIKAAKGEWFMYLDGDDIFESCDDIIHFFNSGEYRKYNSASYLGKNLNDNEGFYVMNKQPRLTKIFKETCFINEIHEVFNIYTAPKKDLKDIAVHYGYLYENDDARKAKYERNKKLLLKRLEKEKDTNAYLYVQICDNEENELNEETFGYIAEGIRVSKKLNDISIIPLLLRKAKIYMLNFKYMEAIEACDEYFSLGKNFRPGTLTADLEFLAMKATCLYRLDKYDEVINVYKRFFELFDLYKQGKLNTQDSDLLLIEGASDRNYVPHLTSLLHSLLKIKQPERAYQYIRKMPVYRYIDEYTKMSSFIKTEVEVLAANGFENVDEYIKNLDDNGKDEFVKELGRVLHYTNEREKALEALRQLGRPILLAKELADIYSGYYEGDLKPEELITFSEKHRTEEAPDIVMIAMNMGWDISAFINEERCDLKKCAWNGYRQYYGFNKAADNYDTGKIDRSALERAAKFYEYCMQCTDDFSSPKPGVFVTINADKLLERYGEIGERIYDIDHDTLPDELKASVVMGNALGYRRAGQFRECIAELKKMLKIYAPLAKYISDYCNDVLNEFNSAKKNEQAGMSEMERLAVAIKNNIKAYLAAGNISAAQKTLSEYETISPGDPEIAELKKMIDNGEI